MKALITAAGMGTRFKELVRDNNKCLLEIGNRSLLDISLNNLNKYGINEVVIVTGHSYDKVEKKLSGRAFFVYNPFYKISGILPSIWLARHKIGLDSFIFITGDSVYHPSILEKCIDTTADIVICVKKKKCDAEDSKIIIKNKKITAMGKDIKEKDATGEFMGMMKISKNATKSFFDTVDALLKEGRLNAYVADVLMELKYKGIKPVVVYAGSKPYIEIDTPLDLKRARKIFR
jgi:choline kinase